MLKVSHFKWVITHVCTVSNSSYTSRSTWTSTYRPQHSIHLGAKRIRDVFFSPKTVDLYFSVWVDVLVLIAHSAVQVLPGRITWSSVLTTWLLTAKKQLEQFIFKVGLQCTRYQRQERERERERECKSASLNLSENKVPDIFSNWILTFILSTEQGHLRTIKLCFKQMQISKFFSYVNLFLSQKYTNSIHAQINENKTYMYKHQTQILGSLFPWLLTCKARTAHHSL